MYQGKTLRAARIAGNFVELCFDRETSAINKLDQLAMRELGEAAKAIAAQNGVRGVLITSAKDSFIVGADITEFFDLFSLPDAELNAIFTRANQSMNALEDLPIPSVVAINGFALGGGLELTLAADLRVMSDAAQVGLPEVNLGLFPGYGGTVRMARIASPQIAVEWMSTGKPAAPAAALAARVVEEVVPADQLRNAALVLLEKAANGEIDWRARRTAKLGPATGAKEAAAEIERTIQGLRARAEQTHQPAAASAAHLISRSIFEPRDAALGLETAEFIQVCRTQAASSSNCSSANNS